MRPSGDGVLALTDAADDLALGDGASARDGDRAELEERHRVSVGGLDRERATAGRDGADKGDDARGGCAHRLAGNGSDVDPAVLPGCIFVRREHERPEDGPVGGPRPAGRDGDEDQGRDRRNDRDGEHAPHRVPPS